MHRADVHVEENEVKEDEKGVKTVSRQIVRRYRELNVPSFFGKFPALFCASPEDMADIGKFLAIRVYKGLSVMLYGDLGSGKTLLARSIGSALGVQGMKSPTFAIVSVHEIPGKNFALVHSDLYRLDSLTGSEGNFGNRNEDVFMSLEEHIADGDALMIEWAERWIAPPNADRWDVRLSIRGGSSRLIEFSAFGEHALGTLADSYENILNLAKF
jgi:tRNA threonylcarbamoyladenosine biosynthesis protein TsaE